MIKKWMISFTLMLIITLSHAQVWTYYNSYNTSTELSSNYIRDIELDSIATVFLDTVYDGEWRVVTTLIPEAEYLQYKASSHSSYYPTCYLSKVSEGANKNIIRLNYDTLIIHLNDGSIRWIPNHPGGEYGLSYEGFRFVDYIPVLDGYLLDVDGYEWCNYRLLDARSGEFDDLLMQTFTIDTLLQRLLTTQYGPEMFGGFIIYSIEETQPVKLFRFEAYNNSGYIDWGISETYWIRKDKYAGIQYFENRKIKSYSNHYVLMKLEPR